MMIQIKEKEIIHFFLLVSLLGLLFGLPKNGYCRDTGLESGIESGIKYYNNYSPKEYGLSPQNWTVLQDKRGVIYVGNTGGLLQFDGVSWREINVPNWLVRSLAMDDKGILYIGGKNEFGFLAPNSKGALQYVSLIDRLNDNHRNFANVWQICSTGKGIYFRTSKFLFRWDSRELKVWEPRHSIRAIFYCKRRLFVQEKEAGLKQMNGDTLELVPGGKKFAVEKIHVMLPYDSKRILIGTRLGGLHLYDGNTFEPFPTGADDYLKEKQLYHGIRLPNGCFALATLRGGLVIIDAKGGLRHMFNKSSGLRDDNVKYVFNDSQGNLWLALNNGISKIEYASPLTVYDERLDLPGIVLSVTVHHPGNVLYAGTTSGLYVLSPRGGTGKFQPVPGITGGCWSLLSTGGSLLAATSDGVFEINNNITKNKNITIRKVIENRSYILYRSPTDPNRTWVGTRRGLIALYKNNGTGQWREEHRFKYINREIRTIAEEENGDLWLGASNGGVLKIDFPPAANRNSSINNPSIENHKIIRFEPSQGLPPKEVNVFWAANHIMFATAKGIFRFDEKNNRFIPDPTLGKQFADGSRSVFRITEDRNIRNKKIWFHSRFKNFLAVPRPGGTYFLESTPFLRIPKTQVNAIYPGPGGKSAWFACNDGLVRYDTAVEKNYRHDFPTLIRRVWVNGNPVFSGFKTGTADNAPPHFPVIDRIDRDLRFEFAAPFYENEPATRYQCRLEGYDDDWTAWNKETKKDYTNLYAGSYTFRVRARNVYNVMSREDVFRFKILPPWYKTWWAYSIYALGFLLLIYLIIKWRSKLHEKEKQALEIIVKDRTKEIEEQKRQLEKQTALLAEQSGKLKEVDKIKSRFFANISHEFRTPITLIMGPLEQMLDACPEHDRDQRKKLRMMLHNCKRLLRLINQLLELSNFESGAMKLQSRPRNIIHFLKGIIDSFEMLADQEELELLFKAQEEDITLYIDDRKMENAICNLLINAIKFTPPGGRITVTCAVEPANSKNFPAGCVKITVADTGPGIPVDKLAGIFERFYQSENTYEHHSKGFGIGLAITKELVQLHHGAIDVGSTEGRGTEFIIRLPMGKHHLTPNEIIELPGVRADHKAGVRADDMSGETPSPHVADAGKWEEEPVEEQAEKDIILVVEDSTDMRNYIKDSLQPRYRVIEAIDGRDGIEKASQIIPDLIVSDIMMPGTDGYELCRELKNNRDTSHIPIILLTAKAAEDNIIEGLETGADDYITKPFNTKILCARIKNLIEIRTRLQQNMKREMPLQPVKMPVSDIDKEFLNDLLAVIEANISDPEFSVEELCNKLYMGRTTMYRKIHALSGETAKEFIRSYRLKRAAELLKNKSASILEVSMEVGFSSSSYFAKCFKEKFHRLPSEYQTSGAQ